MVLSKRNIVVSHVDGGDVYSLLARSFRRTAVCACGGVCGYCRISGVRTALVRCGLDM